MSVIECWIMRHVHFPPTVLVNREQAESCIAAGYEVEGPFVPAEQLQGAVDALWWIATDRPLPPEIRTEYDDDQEYATAVLEGLGVDIASYQPRGQSGALTSPRTDQPKEDR